MSRRSRRQRDVGLKSEIKSFAVSYFVNFWVSNFCASNFQLSNFSVSNFLVSNFWLSIFGSENEAGGGGRFLAKHLVTHLQVCGAAPDADRVDESDQAARRLEFGR